MPSSSSSSVQIIDMPSPGPIPASAPATTVDSSDTDDDDDSGGCALSTPMAERIASSIRRQESLDAICKRHRVPKEFTPLLAGDLRACSTPPPPGAACVYVPALEAGMRLPLHPFFTEVLGHFGIAPGQLTPNGWRVMVGFLALSRSAAGLNQPPPSLAVFRHFFSLCTCRFKGWYCFRGKDSAGALFTNKMQQHITGWKEAFFFLKSPAPWPCPVVWGEPTYWSTAEPVLTGEEESMAAALLLKRGPAAIDLRTYLSESNIAAATKIARAPAPPPPSPSCRTSTTGSKGMDPSTYAMMQSMRAEKVVVKSEPGGCDAPGRTVSSAKKRKLARDEAQPNTPPAAADGSVPGARIQLVYSRQQDKKKPQQVPDLHDGDTADLEAARQLLQGIVTPSRERAFTAAKPSDVIDSTYIAILQAANYASFSMDYARSLQDELAKAKAELAEAKKATAAEVKSAKAEAVEEFLGSKEHERRLVEEALKGYERGMEDMKRVALRLRPDIDEAQLFVPPGGFRQ